MRHFFMSNVLIYFLKFTRGLYFKARGLNTGSKFMVGKSPRLVGLNNISMGHNCSIGDSAWIESIVQYGPSTYSPTITIGDNFICNNYIHIAATGSVVIGNDVLIGSSVLISDHSHGLYSGEGQSTPEEAPVKRTLSVGSIVIGNKVWIGDSVSICGKLTIGNSVIVGANSVVVKNVPDNCIVVGNPAKIIKVWNQESCVWEKYEHCD